jgi:transglutaminase-like putative cysteine protease
MQDPRRHQVGCELELSIETEAILVLQVAAADILHTTRRETLVVRGGDGTANDVTRLSTHHGGRAHLVSCRPGVVSIGYEAAVTAPAPHPQATDPSFDDAAIVALRPSRYCPSDAMAGFAASTFSDDPSPASLAREIASWVFEHLVLAQGTSRSTDSAIDTLLSGAGVCRDFAHLTVALCRAREIPARFVSVYAPGLSPMDFHAVAEVRTEHGWEVLDATRQAPRPSLVRIATGRDAADVAFVTTLRGRAELVKAEIIATIDGSLPTDDHDGAVALA